MIYQEVIDLIKNKTTNLNYLQISLTTDKNANNNNDGLLCYLGNSTKAIDIFTKKIQENSFNYQDSHISIKVHESITQVINSNDVFLWLNLFNRDNEIFKKYVPDTTRQRQIINNFAKIDQREQKQRKRIKNLIC